MNNRRIMIRFVAFFVCVVMIISGNINIITTYASSSDGNQSNDEEYYTIKTVVTDYNEKHNLRLMTQNGHVYAEASVLAQLLGFTFRANKDKFSVMNREDDSLPKITCYFTHNSNDVIRNVSLDHYTYKAPFECIVNKNGYWVPFEYTIYLMNSSLVILDDYVFLERPHKNCIDIMYDEAINKNQYFYDFYNPEVGDTMETLSDWSRIVNVFDGLLTFDGYSWLQYVQSFTGFSKAYDTKYGREVALLMCTVSEDERDTIYQKIGDYSESMDVSSDATSAFFDGLNDHLAKLDTKQNLGELNWAKTVFNNNNSLASANEAYRYMTEAQDRRKLAHLIGEDFATETYDKLSIEIGDLKFGPADYIKVFAGVVQGISYMYQFQHQDDFSRNALNTMLGDSSFEKGVLPQATVEGMSKMVDELDSNIAKYSTYNYIRNNVLNTFKDFINLPKLIGKPGSTLLLGWSLARKLVPFYNEGLSSTHNMEIATYSYVFQKSAFSNYKNLYYKTFNSDSLGTITSQELYPVVQYLYDYLKAGFVSRDAYIGMQTEADLKEFSSYIDKLKSDNQRIAEALIILKDATDTNDYYKSFGILPSENEAFLKKLNDEIIIDFLHNYGVKSSDLSQESISSYHSFQDVIEELTKRYGKLRMKEVDHLNQKAYEANGVCYLSLLDFDEDGIEELFAACKNEEDYGYTGYLYKMSNNNVECVFHNESITTTNPYFPSDELFITYDSSYGYMLLAGYYNSEDDFTYAYAFDGGTFKLIKSRFVLWTEADDEGNPLVIENNSVVEENYLDDEENESGDKDRNISVLLRIENDSESKEEVYRFLQSSIDTVTQKLKMDLSKIDKVINKSGSSVNYNLYMRIIDNLKEKYGDLRTINSHFASLGEESSKEANGICTLQLIDFNFDGIKELLALCKNDYEYSYRAYIFSITDGQASCVLEIDGGINQSYIDYDLGSEGYEWSYGALMIAHNSEGKYVIITGYGEPEYSEEKYYGSTDVGFGLIHSVTYRTSDTENYLNGVDNSEYYIDDVESNLSTYLNIRNEWFSEDGSDPQSLSWNSSKDHLIVRTENLDNAFDETLLKEINEATMKEIMENN